MQQHGSTRRHGGVARANGVTASSAQGNRMRMDQVKGGIKVLNGKDDGGRGGLRRVYGQRLSRNRSDSATLDKSRSKNCKPPESGKSPIKLRKTLSEPAKVVRDSDENCRESGEIGGDGGRGVGEVDVVVDMEKQGFDDKEVDLAGEEIEQEVVEEEEDKKIDQIHEVPISLIAEKTPPDVVDCLEIDPCYMKPLQMEVEDGIYEQNVSGTQDKMQNLVDLVMWREVSRSALVFGIGTFTLISSSYTKELNFSLISAISYLGLIYLAAIFFHKSILHRGVLHLEDCNQKLLIGEAEATWLIKKLLPYINEVLSKIKTLFSGDPATTIKMAMTLFVLARCGGSITIWTMAKLAFFGAFTVPRICSSYSIQIDRYGKFLLERSRDAWDSCTHKKAAAVAAFTVMWNLSSAAARTWAVFMLVVVVRYYQQQLTAMKWGDVDDNNNINPHPEGGATAAELSVEPSEEKDSNGSTRLFRSTDTMPRPL